jgi:hypothetical protein
MKPIAKTEALTSQAAAISQSYKSAVEQTKNSMRAMPKTESLTQQTSAAVDRIQSQAKQSAQAAASAGSKARPAGGKVDMHA